MRIAVFADLFDRGERMAPSLLAGATALARRGHAVLFAIPHSDALDGAELVRAEVDAGEKLEVLRLTSLPRPGGERAVVPTGLAVLRCRTWAPELVHSHGSLGAGLEALATARLLRVPLVGTVHRSVYQASNGPATSSPAARRYVRWYYDRCDLVTSPSGALITAMQDAGLRIPARVAAHPVPLYLRPWAEGVSDRKPRADLGGFTLVHVGPLVAEQRVDEIIHAIPSLITRIPRLSLAIIGRGPEEPSLRLLAERLQVTSHVRFSGPLTGARLADAYRASDVFVTTSRAKMPDLATVEAMASGLPVIGVRTHGLLEHVDASCGVLVEPGDADLLVASILALHRDTPRTAALGAAGRARAARFAPEPLAAEWEGVYAAVLARHQERLVAAQPAPHPTAPRS